MSTFDRENFRPDDTTWALEYGETVNAFPPVPAGEVAGPTNLPIRHRGQTPVGFWVALVAAIPAGGLVVYAAGMLIGGAL